MFSAFDTFREPSIFHAKYSKYTAPAYLSVLSKIGNWIGSIKRYFNSIQNEVTDIESDFEKEISIKEKYSKKTKINDENE